MWHATFETLVHAMIRRGDLTLTMPDGRRIRAGDGTGEPVAATIHDPTLPRRIAWSPELGVGEGYMDGGLTIEGDDLRGFLWLALLNGPGRNTTWWQHALRRGRKGARGVEQWSPAARARRNVAHHYDLSGALYDLFLDADRQYSCAYFARPGMSLDEAQRAKKAHIAAKLLIEPGMRVLDIGCGWGGMALHLARDHGARVLGVTLSEEQLKVARRRAADAGLADRVEFRLTDYRALAGRFDRIVSVGMFEHVGLPQYDAYFAKVRDLLAPGGVALIHTIGRTAPPGITSPWIQKYIFPGGYAPSLSEMAASMERSGLGSTDIEVWRMHYAETLRHWDARFTANRERVEALFDARFFRMWRFYLVASEMTFRHGPQVVFQAQLAHDKQAVPITRDYLHPASGEARLAAE